MSLPIMTRCHVLMLLLDFKGTYKPKVVPFEIGFSQEKHRGNIPPCEAKYKINAIEHRILYII
jgi:hypothetical protein